MLISVVQPMFDDELDSLLVRILHAMDERPPTTWSLRQARLVLAALTCPDASGEVVANLRPGCFAGPRLARLRRVTGPGS